MAEQIEITEDIARKVLVTVDAGLVNGVGIPEPGKMCVEAAVCYAMGLPHGDEPSCVSPALRSLKIRLNDAPWSSDQSRAHGLRRLALAQLGSAGALDERVFANRVARLAVQQEAPFALRTAAAIHPKEEHKKALLSAAAKLETAGNQEDAAARWSAAADAAAADAADAAAAVDASARWSAARWSAAAAAASAAASAAVDASAARWSAAAVDASARWSAARWSAVAAVDAARWSAVAAVAAVAVAADAAAADKHLSDFAERVVQILIEMKAPGCQWLWLTEAA